MSPRAGPRQAGATTKATEVGLFVAPRTTEVGLFVAHWAGPRIR